MPDEPIKALIARLREARAQYLREGEAEPLELGLATFERLRSHPSFTGLPALERGGAINLGAELLLRRYEQLGQDEDLDAAIDLWEHLARTAKAGSELRLAAVSNRASALAARFDALGDPADLERAVGNFRAAVAESAPASHAYGQFQSNLGAALLTHYELGRDGVEALDEAIEAIQSALGSPSTADEVPGTLTNLGLALHLRWSATGRHEDLDAAVDALDAAAQLEPRESPFWPQLAANLADALHDRHVSGGALADLERAVATNEAVLSATRLDSPDWPAGANNLASTLHSRYAATGDLEDLERALELAQSACDAVGADAPERAEYFGTLGVILEERYARTQTLAELERATESYRHASVLAPCASPRRARWLTDLGNALATQAAASDRSSDLDLAIAAHEEAVAITPANSPDLPAYTSNLAVTLLERDEARGTPADVDAAISASERALRNLAAASPERPAILSNLGVALHRRHQRTGAVKDGKRARRAFHTATTQGLQARSETALLVAENWAECAIDTESWDDAADALQQATTAMRRLFSAQLNRSHRETWLQAAQDIPPRATWVNTRRGQFREAVLAMENGRALLLSDALERSRADLVSLRAAGREELAERFRRAAARVAALEAAAYDRAPTRQARPARPPAADGDRSRASHGAG